MTYDIKYAGGTNNMRTASKSYKYKNVLNFTHMKMTATHRTTYIHKQVTSQ